MLTRKVKKVSKIDNLSTAVKKVNKVSSPITVETVEEKKEELKTPTQSSEVDISGDCNICCSPFTKVKRKPIECNFCNFQVCMTCLQKYLTGVPDTHCMNCKKIWPQEILVKNFSKTFVFDTLFKHQVDVLASLEKSLFEETLQEITLEEQQRERDNVANKITNIVEFCERQTESLERARRSNCTLTGFNFDLDLKAKNVFENFKYVNSLDTEIVKRYFETSASFTSIYNDPAEFKEEITRLQQKNLNEKVTESERTHIHFLNVLKRIGSVVLKLTSYKGSYTDIVTIVYQTQIDKAQEFCTKLMELISGHNMNVCNINGKVKKLTRCYTEKCAGYLVPVGIDTNVGECKLCSKQFCIECSELCTTSSEEHKCNPDTLASVKLIRQDSTPCPSCKTSISRIHGCDQMFCTNCTTAFDYKTGEIIHGRIHNPEYFAWLKKNENKEAPPNNENNNECRELGWIFDYRNALSSTIELISNHKNMTKEYKDLESESNIVAMMSFCIVDLHHKMIEFVDDHENNFGNNMLENPFQRYRILRKRFLRGDYDEHHWKTLLAREKKSYDEFIKERNQSETLILILSDIFYHFLTHIRNHELFETKYNEYVKSTYKSIVDACVYYNNTSKNNAILDNKTTYKVILHPNPKIFTAYSSSYARSIHPKNRNKYKYLFFNFTTNSTVYISKDYILMPNELTDNTNFTDQVKQLAKDIIHKYSYKASYSPLEYVEIFNKGLTVGFEQDQFDEYAENVRKQAKKQQIKLPELTIIKNMFKKQIEQIIGSSYLFIRIMSSLQPFYQDDLEPILLANVSNFKLYCENFDYWVQLAATIKMFNIPFDTTVNKDPNNIFKYETKILNKLSNIFNVDIDEAKNYFLFFNYMHRKDITKIMKSGLNETFASPLYVTHQLPLPTLTTNLLQDKFKLPTTPISIQCGLHLIPYLTDSITHNISSVSQHIKWSPSLARVSCENQELPFGVILLYYKSIDLLNTLNKLSDNNRISIKLEVSNILNKIRIAISRLLSDYSHSDIKTYLSVYSTQNEGVKKIFEIIMMVFESLRHNKLIFYVTKVDDITNYFDKTKNLVDEYQYQNVCIAGDKEDKEIMSLYSQYNGNHASRTFNILMFIYQLYYFDYYSTLLEDTNSLKVTSYIVKLNNRSVIMKYITFNTIDDDSDKPQNIIISSRDGLWENGFVNEDEDDEIDDEDFWDTDTEYNHDDDINEFM